MKALLVALGLLLATSASADLTYYVSKADGNDAANGLTYATRWKTIAQANKSAASGGMAQPNTTNGDVTLYVERWSTNDYDAIPNPSEIPANGKRFVITSALGGVEDITQPALTRLPAGTINAKYTQYQGFSFSGPVTMDSTSATRTGDRVRIKNSIFNNDLTINCDYSKVLDCTLNGHLFIASVGGSHFVALSDSIHTLLMPNNFSSNNNPCVKLGYSTVGFVNDGRVDSLDVAWPKWTITMTGDQCPALSFNHVGRSRFYGAKWLVHNQSSQPSCGSYMQVFKLRDASVGNTFRADTLIQDRTNPSFFDFCEIGSEGDSNGATNSTVIDSCYFFNVAGPNTCQAARATLNFSGGLHSSTITYTTVVSQQGEAIRFNGAPALSGTNNISHCTLFGTPAALNVDRSATWGTTTLTFKSNIVARYGATGVLACKDDDYHPTAGAFWGDEPKTGMLSGSKLKSNYNLYMNHTYTTNPGDKSIIYVDGGFAFKCSKPAAEPFKTAAHADSNSTWGDAWFGGGSADSIPNISFSPALGYYSHARGAGQFSTDAGAVAWVSTPKIRVTETSLSFNGQTATLYQNVHISNVGTDTLKVTKIDGGCYAETCPAQLNYIGTAPTDVPGGELRILPGDSIIAVFSLDEHGLCSGASSRSGVLTIVCNDVSLPAVSIPDSPICNPNVVTSYSHGIQIPWTAQP